MFVLEVYIRRDRKEGTRKGKHADTQECYEGQGTVLTPRAGKSAALAHSGGCGFPPASYIQTKPLEKKAFLNTGRQKVNPNKELKKSKKAPAGHKILPLSWT